MRKRLSFLKNKLFGFKSHFVRTSFLGIQLLLYPTTVRRKFDYDDAWFYSLVKESKVFFDVGANIGYTAILAKLSKGPEQLVLIDPNPEALSIAAANLVLNKLSTHCHFVPFFIGDEENQVVKFFTVASGAAGSVFRSHSKTASKLNAWIPVETKTLNGLAQDLNLKPDFVKIDVEGFEHNVLCGAKQIAQSKAVRFLIEMHANSEVSMTENAAKVLGWCKENGYMAWYLERHKVLDSPQEIAHRGRCHLLVQPESWEFPRNLLDIKQGDPIANL